MFENLNKDIVSIVLTNLASIEDIVNSSQVNPNIRNLLKYNKGKKFNIEHTIDGRKAPLCSFENHIVDYVNNLAEIVDIEPSTIFSMIEAHKFEKANMTGLTFINDKLQNYTFKNTEMMKNKFINLKIISTLFERVNLEGLISDRLRVHNSQMLCNDFANSQFNNALFESVEFTGSSFGFASIKSASFNSCRMYNTDFSGAVLDCTFMSCAFQSIFDNSRIDNAIFNSCEFTQTSFKDVDLSKTGFVGYNIFQFCDFTGAKLNIQNFNRKDAIYTGSMMPNQKFVYRESADMSRSDFESTILTRCTFQNITFNSANMKHSNMDFVTIANCMIVNVLTNTALNALQLYESDVEQCTFANNFMECSQISKSAISSSFMHVKLSETKFYDCTVRSVFQSCDMNKMHFIKTYLSNCVLKYNMCEGTTFKNCTIKNSEIHEIVFEDCVFDSVKFEENTLRNVCFVNCIFEDCSQKNCNLEDVEGFIA